jgi:hypothetical protein
VSDDPVMSGFRFIKSMQILSIEEIGQFIKEELYKDHPSEWKIERALQVAKLKYDRTNK